MFAWWGRAVVRLRWVVVAAAGVLVVIGASWGTGVFGSLGGGGFDDPASESSRAHQRITAELGDQGVDLLVLYSSETMTVDQPAFQDSVTATLVRVRERPEVANVTSWYETRAPALLATDRQATYALVRLRATTADDKVASLKKLRPALDAPGVRTEVGGSVAFLHTANEQSTEDITRAEMLSMPVLLVLLILIFGGLVAASMPLLIGGLAILGGFVAVRLLTLVTDVSVFAINIITLIGLGMAIDYALFMVSRFREELTAGHSPVGDAAAMATAGRTVMVSGIDHRAGPGQPVDFSADVPPLHGPRWDGCRTGRDARVADRAAGAAGRARATDQRVARAAALAPTCRAGAQPHGAGPVPGRDSRTA